jgi:outer membrane protein assembly factor BamB
MRTETLLEGRFGWLIALVALLDLSASAAESWAFTTGGSVVSSPAIGADGAVFVGSHDH